MADLGVEMTDKRVDEIKERLLSAYKEAASDLQKKAEEHTKRFEEKDKQKRADRDNGKLSEEDYQKWLKGQVFIGKQWQSKVDQMTRMLTNAEKVAVQIVRDGQMATFADNANYTEYCIDKDTGFGVNFSLYDESTVMLLLQDQPELMPRRVVDDEKCEAWNQKVIANCITQGILQGESIPQIAKRMARDTATTDMKAMVRYARTAMTGAQNSGRIYAMEKSIEQGVEVKKVWIATLDERTRDAHADLDGQIQDVKEPFDSQLGPIMYPGDPGADEANVWNCRCTLGYEYPDSPSKGQRYDQMFGEDIDDMTFDEWFEWRKGQIKDKYADRNGTQQGDRIANHHVVVEGKDISKTWERRKDMFDFAIDDVINAQGFDGLPQVVSAEEFDRLKEDAPIYGFRGYSAPDAETLSEYQKQLYSGKWYVDCHVGTAAYGQGMYMQGVLDTSNESGIAISKMIAEGYGQSRGNPVYNVEEMLLSPDAKGVSLYLSPGNHTSVENFTKFTMDYMTENAAGKWTDQGVYAAAKGYDYMCLDSGNGSQEIIVLNRTKLIIKGGE